MKEHLHKLAELLVSKYYYTFQIYPLKLKSPESRPLQIPSPHFFHIWNR